MRFLLLAICIVGAVANEVDDYQPRIFGGFLASITEFKFQVSLQTKGLLGWSHICGGSIIEKQWIVTAAHCVNGRNATEIEVLAGVSNLIHLPFTKQDGQRLKVELIIIHPQYKGEVAPHDIALLKLVGEFEFNDYVGKIDLPEQDEESSGIAILSGWGYTIPFLPITPALLRKSFLLIISHLVCNVGFLGGVDKDANICTRSAIIGAACSGDSGGPLCQDGKLIGIVSWGRTLCGTGATVYTKVSHYRNFINDKMAL